MAQSRALRQSKRNYRNEYDAYQGQPKQLKNRAARNAARREYEKVQGAVPSSMDIDHIKPLVKGGGNSAANLRIRNRNANRSFKRTKKAKMK